MQISESRGQPSLLLGMHLRTLDKMAAEPTYQIQLPK